MNKIIIDNNKHTLVDFVGEACINLDSSIDIEGSCELLIKEFHERVTFNMKDNSYLNIIFFDNNKINDCEIVINQSNDTKLYFKDLFESVKDVNVKIFVNVQGNNNYSNVNVSCVSSNGNVSILEQINALSGTKNNDATERVKGLMCGGNIEVLPNMLIDSNEIIANHFVTISSFNKDTLFYLESKGINEDIAKKLIKDSYLYYEF